MYIDAHTHCRDFEEAYKETIQHALLVAENSGLSGIFDMPNTKPPLITRAVVERRLELAKKCASPVFYGIFIGLTNKKDQIKEAVETFNEFFPNKGDERVGVIGLKMYAGKSTNNLTVEDILSQRSVFAILAELNFKGVISLHCEKESVMNEKLWDPKNPISHCDVRSEEAEIQSVKDQIQCAQETNFKGHLHITHISSPQSVDIVNKTKHALRLSSGVTFHHLLLDKNVMTNEKGIFYKVNPPLRSPESRAQLFAKFNNGEIDILETDHAPHTYEDKIERHSSGIPNLASWPKVIEILKARGIAENFLQKVAFENVNKIFGIKIPRRKAKNNTIYVKDYLFDPYEKIV